MTELDWNLIRSFAAVADTGSLSGAARRLRASQPTVGRHVAELESELGVVLFRRGKRGYELTDQGAALFDRARAMRDDADAFALLATGATKRIAGTVRIAASEIVSAYVLPPILLRLRLEEPGIEIELVPSNRVENLLRRDADIAVRMVEPAQQTSSHARSPICRSSPARRRPISTGAAGRNNRRNSSSMISSVSTARPI